MSEVWLWWSSGKDSAWALHELRHQREAGGAFEVTGLVTTLNGEADRVAMHAVRRELLLAQGRAAGLPVEVCPLPFSCTNEQYEAAVAPVVERAVAAGVRHMAFGDLFLEDVRQYREKLLAGTGVAPLFPLWGRDTGALAREMIAAGLAARVTCIDPRRMPRSAAGTLFDEAFLAALPEGVDPCAENGEFHTFAFRGPMFAEEVAVETGEVVEREGFVYCDLAPAGLGETLPAGSGEA